MDPVTKEVVQWNPFTEGYFRDPYPHLHRCRETNPVQRGHSGEWILLRYDQVKEALRSPDFQTGDLSGFFQKKEPIIFKNTTQCPFLSRTTSHWLPYLNDDLHVRARELVERALARFDLKKMVTECVGKLFDEHIEDSFDATVFGAALPSLMFNAMYGGSWDTKEGVKHLQKISHSLAVSQDIFVPIKTYQSINDDMQWFFETVANDFQDNRADRPLLDYMEEENNKLALGFSHDDMISMIGILLLGSIETTQISVSTIIHELMKDRDLLAYISGADDVSINILTEEFFRYIAPQQYTIRINKKELNLGGNVIPPGSRFFLSLASANRDPSVFPDHDKIVRDRKNNPHLSFGSGVHACVGSKLARMEMRALLKPLAAALTGFRLDPAQTPEWHKSIFIRGYKNLRITRG